MTQEEIQSMAQQALQLLDRDEAVLFGTLCITQTERLTVELNKYAGQPLTREILLACMACVREVS